MGYYDTVEELQSLAWRNDDRMDQDTLFELQGKLADFALLVAKNEGRLHQLLMKFPWLYEKAGD